MPAEFPPRPTTISDQPVEERWHRIKAIANEFMARDNRPPADPEESAEVYERLYREVIDSLQSVGAEFVENGDVILKQTNPSWLIRREYFPALAEALLHHQPLKIEPQMPASEDPRNSVNHHDNCAVFSDAGVRMSAEGLGHLGGLAAFVIFKPDQERMAIVNNHEEQGVDSIGRDRSTGRSMRGEIKPEDIQAIVLRFPGKKMPETVLTEEEQERNPAYIYRGFRFLKEQGKKAAA